MLEKKVFVGMNKDNSAKDLRPEEYRHAVNLVAVTDGVGTSTRLENMLGMRETGMPVSADGVCIGLWNYREKNKIYGFYQGSTDFIIEYDGVTDVGTPLMQNNLLGFQIGFPVHDVFLIENLLYFNDANHGLRKINIDYAKTGALNSITDERALSLIKTPPLKWLTHNRLTDTNLPTVRPSIRDTPLQFASRYIYDDDEVSVISPISHIAPAVDWDVDDNHWNYIEVLFHIDAALEEIINKVELLVRVGNDGVWFVYNSFTPDTFTIVNADGTKSQEYDVYLDRTGAILSEEEAGTSAESVPRRSDAMALMENRLFATSSLEEYDTAEDDWFCGISLFPNNGAASLELDDEIYTPQYYKEDSDYTWGIVFMDETGRETAPVVRTQMHRRIPKTLVPYEINGTIDPIFTYRQYYNHPAPYRATPYTTGKPPIWAKKYQFTRTENRTYSSWFKAGFQIKPLFNTNKQTEEPSASFQSQFGVYLENGYWYYDIEWYLQKFKDGANTEVFIPFSHCDLIIPDGIPVPIDSETVLKLAFDYPITDGVSQTQHQVKYRITQVEDGRLRVKGLSWIDFEKIFIDEEDILYGSTLPGSKPVLPAEYQKIHLELLNPKNKNNTPLHYKIGKVYGIQNAGLANRSFDSPHNYVHGDCYYTAYNEDEGFITASTFNTLTFRTARYQRSISYCSISPIADIKRAGNPIGVDEEGNTASSSVEGGRYWATAHDSKGRPTIEVPNQKEIERGSQVRWSRTYIQDSLINGLSNFPEENKHTISFDRGDVIKLVPTNERVLLAIHARSMTSLYINQRFINSGEGEAFLAQTDSVIGDDRKLLLNLGTTHPESVVSHDSRVYGFDSIMSEPWRRSQDGITPLALTFGMKTYFEEKGEQIRRVKTLDPSAVVTVLGGYDQWLDMFVLTFSKIEYVDNGDPITIEAETIGFSERVKRWVSFYSFKPEYYSSIMNNLVSAKDQSLWRHMDTEDRNLFYGDYYNSSITINSRESNDLPKIYQNLGISSTDRWSMTCKTVDGKESLLTKSNFILRDNIWYAEFLRDKNTDSGGLTGNQTPLLHGEKMIGETLEITFTNDNSQRVVLDAVYIGYSPMAGHLLSQT